MLQPYRPESFTDFSVPKHVEEIQKALAEFAALKDCHYPLIIGGEAVTTETKITSRNPSRFDEIVGTVSSATSELADRAVAVATEAFQSWRLVPAQERAYLLLKAAAILRRRKRFFSAILIQEAGKNFAEADGDVCEAIDFLEYYARQMLDLDKGMTVHYYPGEINDAVYIPLGVGLVIAPWNFPLAILVGMTAAAAVTGNTVIMKPASETAVVAAQMMSVFTEAGFPAGVINFLPGPGADVGSYLAAHPKIRFINFTGSKAVGLSIHEQAAKVVPGQRWIKRTSLELGGKDAMLIDSDCNLEDAADAIVAAAFGFQGQKCSACSRAIIVAEVYDRMVELIAERANRLVVGAADCPTTNVGPVISQKAMQTIKEYIEIGHSEGRLITASREVPTDGFYIEPTIFADVSPEARIAREEIFGPVLALVKVADFAEAIEVGNSTEYGLTGGVFTNNRANLTLARTSFHVGNLYLNRKCTGALVGIQPFGGFGLSGTDSKAGGADYLQLFMQVKSIAERL